MMKEMAEKRENRVLKIENPERERERERESKRERAGCVPDEEELCDSLRKAPKWFPSGRKILVTESGVTSLPE